MKRRETFVAPTAVDTEAIAEATRLYNSAVAWTAVDELFHGVMFR